MSVIPITSESLDASALTAMAKHKDCTPGQLALAFLLAHIELSRTEWFKLYESGLGQPVP